MTLVFFKFKRNVRVQMHAGSRIHKLQTQFRSVSQANKQVRAWMQSQAAA